ncbi:MAG: ABC transporter permease [Clostridia bacterium]|nr:ABC transporter permease [Clostridia bacterium]
MKKKYRPSVPGVLGAMLVIAGLIGLYSGPAMSQYVFAPKDINASQVLSETQKELGTDSGSIALHGSTAGLAVGTEKKTVSGVTLYRVSGDWHSVYAQELVRGRLIAAGDVEAGSQVAVLDESTAFQLFGELDPIGRQVKIEDKVYETVGVVKHVRRIGEEDACAAWIPLGVSGAPQSDVMVFSAGGGGLSAMHTTFEKTARDRFGDGQAFHLGKERNRGTVLLRVMALVIGIRLLAVWFRYAKRRSVIWRGQIREKGQNVYAGKLIGFALIRVAGMLLLFGAGIGVGVLLVMMMADVMLQFPEWIPRVLVDPDAIRETFWSLTAAAAKPMQWKTPEMAEIRFWSGMIRWGAVLFLLDRWRVGKRNETRK